ncbi:MAG TPA: NAD(P)H-dependent oxidoreductase subunit E [Solibacterales bacterium]|nr:NAD(P)H-dependent oxidoreductase subunit E [Bryobacterales bacterium]
MQELLDEVIARRLGRPGALLGILEELQEKHPNKYLPMRVLDAVAARTGIPRAQVYSVVTFYSLFNLEPQGRHSVCICRGTACHTRGSRALLERLKLELGLKQGDPAGDGSADKLSMTTPEGDFTLRTVACFGQCALAPVVEIDHHIYSHVNEQRLHTEIQALREE